MESTLNKKLPGFTLVETFMAFVLVAIAFGAVMMIFLNIHLTPAAMHADASYLLEKELSNIIRESQYYDANYSIKEYGIKRKIDAVNDNKELIKLTIEVTLEGRSLGKKSEFVIFP